MKGLNTFRGEMEKNDGGILGNMAIQVSSKKSRPKNQSFKNQFFYQKNFQASDSFMLKLN